MSIPKALDAQRDFSAGQLDSNAIRRDDTEIHKSALKRARNIRPLETGGAARRPGRRIRYFGAGKADRVRPTADTEFDVQFAAETFTARLVDGTVNTTLSGCPWTADLMAELSIFWIDKAIYVAHRSMQTQIITYDPDSDSWSRAGFAFRVGLNGETRMPFYRFAAFGVTLDPSAITGAITLFFSAPVLNAGHVGSIFRYVERQILITAVIDSENAEGTVIQELPRSQRLTVGSTIGFSVGEVVEGDTTNTTAEIATVVSATQLDVVLMSNFSGFSATEVIVGPNATSTASAVSVVSPLASVQWDEQFVGDYRGWPGSVSFVRQRLCLTDFNQFPGAIIWSSVSAPDDVKITAAADGAIFEYVPNGRSLYVIDGADPFVFTDSGVYFIPVSASTPLAVGSVEFRPISAEGAARVRPVLTGDGAVFISANRKRIYAIVGTGQNSRPYIARPINDLHTQLFNDPIALAAVAGAGGIGGQHLYVVNTDGSMAVGRYDEGRDWVGWFPWDGDGMVLDVAGRFDQLTIMVKYTTALSDVFTVEELDQDLRMDGIFDFDDSVALLAFAGATLQAMSGNYHLGPAVISNLGVLETAFEETDVILGSAYIVNPKPFIENFEGGQDFGQRKRRRKVASAVITVRDTDEFVADGRTFARFLPGEPVVADNPGRDATYRWRQKGRAWDPDVDIIQENPGRFTMLELTVEVTV